MKRFLILLMLLVVCLGASAATTIQWFHQQPEVTALSNEMRAVFESGASNQYFSAPLSVLRTFTSGSTNGANAFFTNTYVQNLTNNYLFSTNLFATNVYENFVTNNYLFTTNLFATNVYENFTTNNYLFSTNLFATNVYVDFFTNNWMVTTNLYATNTYIQYLTNDYAWSTNINVLNDITVQSNVYVTNIITAKTAYITNLTVINTLTANMDALTNSNGYVGAAMADTNWVLGQIANLGSYIYFLGPTNTFAITNSSESVSRTNIWKGSLVPYVTAATQTVSGLVLNAYVRHVISTNTFSAIEAGPISITSYPFRTGAAGTVSGHWEIYWVDTVSNIMHEIAAAPTQIIASTAPVFTQTSLTLTNGYTFTNKAYIACAFRLDSIGSGGPSLSWAYGGDYDAHLTFTRPLSSATINASQIVGIITNEVDTAGTVTATAYKVYTNSWAGATNSIDLTYGWVKYLAYTPCSVTGLTGKGSTGKKVQNTLLTITNAASTNITLYYTGTIRTGDGARSWTITNACEGVLSLEFDPNDSTNAVFRMFY